MRRVKDGCRRPDFDNNTTMHYCDPVGDFGNHGELVGDEQYGQTQLVAQVKEQVQQLGLNRHVECTHRFVRNQDIGTGCERTCNGYALTLSPREFTRLAPRHGRRQAHQIEESRYERSAVLAAGLMVHSTGFEDRRADGEPRVERRVWVLEHHLHASTDLSQLSSARGTNTAPLESDRTVVWFDETDQHPCDRRLAAARAARQAENFAVGEVKAHVIDRKVTIDGSSPYPLS